jgi:hypothetical protein
MTEFEFFDEIPMDKGHALDQQTARFQTVRDGLPELVKNSKDQYARLGTIEKIDRQVVVVTNDESRTIAVLDFAGATSEDFDGWTTWSSRTANHPLSERTRRFHEKETSEQPGMALGSLTVRLFSCIFDLFAKNYSLEGGVK